MNANANFQALAARLDSFPQRFPSTTSGVELQLLAQLFTPKEAGLAANFILDFTPLGEAGKGLIKIKRGESGLEVRLLPFIVGFYENQVDRIDEVFANLFEAYYREASHDLLSMEPQFHRIIPVKETINTQVEILPEDNVVALLSSKSAWGVMDCICRKQKALIGEGCDHPLKVCLILSETPGVFDDLEGIEALDLDDALEVLDRAAAAGLVHTVSAHIANVVARSAYVAQVYDDACIGCGICEDLCQFDAISIKETSIIDQETCVGCGVCARSCPEDAVSLSLRPAGEILHVPNSFEAWLEEREKVRKEI